MTKKSSVEPYAGDRVEETLNPIAYCSKSPYASSGKSFVVIQDATKSRAANDGSILVLDDRARRDQCIAQPLMITLAVDQGIAFPRIGAGSIPCSFRILRIVPRPSVWPRLAIAPWMRV